jgi:hypothetical protein
VLFVLVGVGRGELGDCMGLTCIFLPFSATVSNVDDPIKRPKTALQADSDAMLEALDAPTTAPAWTARCNITPAGKTAPLPLPHGPTDAAIAFSTASSASPDGLLMACIVAACKAIVGAELELDDLDKKVGDGDCGATLAKGAAAAAAAAVAGELRGGASAVAIALAHLGQCRLFFKFL